MSGEYHAAVRRAPAECRSPCFLVSGSQHASHHTDERDKQCHRTDGGKQADSHFGKLLYSLHRTRHILYMHAAHLLSIGQVLFDLRADRSSICLRNALHKHLIRAFGLRRDTRIRHIDQMRCNRRQHSAECPRRCPHNTAYREVTVSAPFTFSRIFRPVIFVRLYSVCARSSPTTATGSAFAHCHAFGSVPASISICMTSPSRSSTPRSTACSVVCPTRTVPLCALIGISVRMPSTSCSISSASAAREYRSRVSAFRVHR